MTLMFCLSYGIGRKHQQVENDINPKHVDPTSGLQHLGIQNVAFD